MNWKYLRPWPWIDHRAKFISTLPRGGTLLDIGSSTGETLNHIAELRPDLRLVATDIDGTPEQYPSGTQFHRADITRDSLPLTDGSLDGITCMQVVEHLPALDNLIRESARTLKPGASIFFETPHPKTVSLDSPTGVAAGTFTLNFYDDPTHLQPVSPGRLALHCRSQGLEIVGSGISRNLVFALSWPAYFWMKNSRRKLTAKTHWLGWSCYVIAQRLR
jgi:2-polyprenyl-3-methyl-5-hydroxy-6-metoxy-1,4-benzoquinol methylase